MTDQAEVDVSVVIPVRNGSATIGRCLDALAAQVGAPPFEVIVVDNGSIDGTKAIATSHALGPIFIEEGQGGSYAARNAGIRQATGSILAFTDADCAPTPGWLRNAVEALGRGADLVGGAVHSDIGPNPNRWEEWDARHYLTQRQFVERRSFAATANLTVRRAVTEDIGGFDAALVSSGDVEFCHRAVRAGHRLVYDESAAVVHEPRRTLKNTWKLNRRIGAGIAVLTKTGRGWGDLPEKKRDTADALKVRVRRKIRLAPVFAVSRTAYFVGRVTRRA